MGVGRGPPSLFGRPPHHLLSIIWGRIWGATLHYCFQSGVKPQIGPQILRKSLVRGRSKSGPDSPNFARRRSSFRSDDWSLPSGLCGRSSPPTDASGHARVAQPSGGLVPSRLPTLCRDPSLRALHFALRRHARGAPNKLKSNARGRQLSMARCMCFVGIGAERVGSRSEHSNALVAAESSLASYGRAL